MGKKVTTILSKPQAEFRFAQEKNVAVVSGFGAGKTEADLFTIGDSMREFPRNDFLYLAPTLPLVKDIWYPKIEEHFTNLNEKFTIDQQRNIVKVHGRGNIYCRSMEHPDRLVGFEVLDAFVDELDILKKEKALAVIHKLKGRLRQKPIYVGKTKKLRKKFKLGKKRNQMYVSTTPEGFRTTHDIFVKNPLKNSRLIQMSTYSNAHNLPKDYIEELYSIYPPNLIDAYIYGKFTNLTQGSVYPTFDRVMNNILIRQEHKEPLKIGMDFNVGKMAAIIHVIRNGLPIAVGEIFKVADTPAMIVAINELYPGHPISIYPDATGQNRKSSDASTSDLKLLRNAGFLVRANFTNPRIKDRINSVNAMFCNIKGQRRYLVNGALCPNYIDCLEQQAYDKNGLPDKQSDLDHLPDAGGYFISFEYGLSKPSSQSRRLIM